MRWLNRYRVLENANGSTTEPAKDGLCEFVRAVIARLSAYGLETIIAAVGLIAVTMYFGWCL